MVVPRRPLLLSTALALALSIGLAASAAWASGPGFAKGPYLQVVGQRSVAVRWEGNEPAPGVVSLRGPGGATREVKDDAIALLHTVTVAGLEPATAYTYAVTAGEVKSGEGRLVTAPDDARPFSFLLYGDNRSDERSHAVVVRAMLAVPSDFLVHTGDMVAEGNDDTDWASFFRIEAPLLRDRCVFACVGNHEMVGGNALRYLRYLQPPTQDGPRPLFYSMRWGNSRFFFLNAFAGWSGGPDRAWLDGELSRADAEPGLAHRFVVMHHAPYSSGPHGKNKEFLRANLQNALKEHHVTMVLAGHDHLYERGELDGLRYVISGGGGAPLYRPRAPLAATQAVEASHHFVEVRVDGSEVTTTARRVDGSVMETCKVVEAGWACEGSLKPVVHPPPGSVGGTGGGGAVRRACDCGVPGRGAPSPDARALLAFVALLGVRRLLRTAKLS
jgi:acid phosphatase type 7